MRREGGVACCRESWTLMTDCIRGRVSLRTLRFLWVGLGEHRKKRVSKISSLAVTGLGCL